MRRSYLAHREERIAKAALWAKANPESYRVSQRKYDASERGRAKAAAGYQANRAERDARVKVRNALNPEPKRERNRGRDRRCSGRIDRQTVWERDEGICGICGEAADRNDWHMDHVIPVIRGGEHTMENVQVSHPTCNRKKGARGA